MKKGMKSGGACALAFFYAAWGATAASGYAYNEIVPDVRQAASISGGSACPVRSHIRAVAAARAVQWSTALGTNPLTIITQDQTPNGRLAEIEQVITQSLGVWSGVIRAKLAKSWTRIFISIRAIRARVTRHRWR